MLSHRIRRANFIKYSEKALNCPSHIGTLGNTKIVIILFVGDEVTVRDITEAVVSKN